MASPGSRVDWGDNGWGQSKRLSKASFSGLLARDKSPRSNKNNNKNTQSVTRGGGQVSQQKIAGLDGLHVTRVDRAVNTAKNKNNQITKGGGGLPSNIELGHPAAVKVRPEQ